MEDIAKRVLKDMVHYYKISRSNKVTLNAHTSSKVLMNVNNLFGKKIKFAALKFYALQEKKNLDIF